VVIADDEPLARDELRYLLNQIEGINILGEAKDGQEVLRIVKELSPDVLFLDIRMPPPDGMAITREILNLGLKTKIIFATAYDEYAIKAFELNAMDYLLKPFTPKRVAQALKKFQGSMERDKDFLLRLERLITAWEKGQGLLMKVPVEKNKKVLLIDVNDILWISAREGLVFVREEKEEYLTNLTLKKLERRLDPRIFFRAHRRYLVNLNKVEEIIPWSGWTHRLIVSGMKREEIPLSRSQAKKLRQLLNW
jgi:DNA-binding LytR/AlgR family response regulator